MHETVSPSQVDMGKDTEEEQAADQASTKAVRYEAAEEAAQCDMAPGSINGEQRSSRSNDAA